MARYRQSSQKIESKLINFCPFPSSFWSFFFRVATAAAAVVCVSLSLMKIPFALLYGFNPLIIHFRYGPSQILVYSSRKVAP